MSKTSCYFCRSQFNAYLSIPVFSGEPINYKVIYVLTRGKKRLQCDTLSYVYILLIKLTKVPMYIHCVVIYSEILTSQNFLLGAASFHSPVTTYFASILVAHYICSNNFIL